MRVLYHGSDHIIERPVQGGGRRGNDYGDGFYCTEDIELAREWSCLTERGGVVNEYTIDEEALTIVDLSSPAYTAMNWIAILLRNRDLRLSSAVEEDGKQYILEHFLPDVSSADVITG